MTVCWACSVHEPLGYMDVMNSPMHATVGKPCGLHATWLHEPLGCMPARLFALQAKVIVEQYTTKGCMGMDASIYAHQS